MQGKVVVVTGGTSGIGQVAADALAGAGARIVLIARESSRGEAALARLRRLSPGTAHTIHLADLSRVREVERVGDRIVAEEARIDVLINNAGAMFNRRQVTPDGLELTFALNHMGYFVLTERLRARLIASAPARIVNTASGAHYRAKLDFNDLQSSRDYSGFSVYARSKLCNILYTRELARNLAGTGVTANCLHPGFVATRFGDGSGGVLALGVRLAKLFAIPPARGAETIVYLASSSDVASSTGGYFYECRPATPSREARDDAAAARLWAESLRLAGELGVRPP